MDLQDKSQEFKDLYAVANPLPGARAKVPLLEVKSPLLSDVLLTESLVVADYIAEQFGEKITTTTNNNNLPSLLPALAHERATTRLFTVLCGGSAFSYFPLVRDAEGEKREAAMQTFQDGLVGANAFLKHHHNSAGPFLLGDRFSLAECNAAPFVQRACTILPAFCQIDPLELCDELKLDHLKQWMEAVLARPSVIATGVSKEKLLEGTTAMLARFAAMEQK